MSGGYVYGLSLKGRTFADWLGDVQVTILNREAADLWGLVAEAGHVSALNCQGDGGRSALMIASWWAKPEACKVLLAAGADPSLRDIHGGSAHSVGRYLDSPPAEAVAACRLVLETYGAYARGPIPWPCRVRIDAVRRQVIIPNDRLREIQASLDAALSRRPGREPLWDGRRGRLWLLPGEIPEARAAVAGVRERGVRLGFDAGEEWEPASAGRN